MLFQPKAGIIQADRNPPPAAPRENPQNATVIRNERLRCGAYSDTRILAFGMAAPSPSPVRKRRITMVLMSGENAVARVHRPNMDTLLTSTILRP